MSGVEVTRWLTWSNDRVSPNVDDRGVDSWDDITGTTPLTVSGNVVSFVTSVSARSTRRLFDNYMQRQTEDILVLSVCRHRHVKVVTAFT